MYVCEYVCATLRFRVCVRFAGGLLRDEKLKEERLVPCFFFPSFFRSFENEFLHCRSCGRVLEGGAYSFRSKTARKYIYRIAVSPRRGVTRNPNFVNVVRRQKKKRRKVRRKKKTM